MKNIDSKVMKAIQKFVSDNQSFISLDIYCLLGVRIEDDEYPIHQQVRDAFVAGTMPNYLSEWITLSLECGGFANVWRYYLPKVEVKSIPLMKRSDGRIELTKEALGHFPLLDADIGLHISEGTITLNLDVEDAEQIFTDLEKRVRFGKLALEKAKLIEQDVLMARIYPTKIEITGNM
jgi:hypothetical protein